MIIMKENLIAYINSRIDWHQQEQARLKAEYRQDEAVLMQIATNVYRIFLSTYQAMKFDLGETLQRFSSIMSTWDESHKQAHAHDDATKQLIEEIKIARAMEILRAAKEMEASA